MDSGSVENKQQPSIVATHLYFSMKMLEAKFVGVCLHSIVCQPFLVHSTSKQTIATKTMGDGTFAT